MQEGKTSAIQWVAQDINERKRVEKGLKESEVIFRSIVEELPNTIIYIAALDERSTTFYISNQVKDILGYTQEEFKDDPDIWAKCIHPDDQGRVMAELGRCHKTGKAFTSEYRMIRKDGQVIWFRDDAQVIRDKRGKKKYLLGINSDISERKQAEESLRERERDLEIKTRSLNELNIALNVLLKKREGDKAELEEKIVVHIRDLIWPFLEKLRESRLDESQKTYMAIIESNLKDISLSFSSKASSQYLELTPTEIQVASLIRQGKRNKEIASMLNTSTRTIAFHRENIRKKLAINGKKTNLKSYLLTQKI